MTTSVKQMMEAANAAVPKITPAQAREMISKGNTLVVIGISSFVGNSSCDGPR